METRDSARKCDDSTPARPTLSPARSPMLSTSLVDVVSKLDAVLEGVRSYEQRIEGLEQRVGEAQSAQLSLAERLSVAEERAASVTSLYVATYQLHASLDP